MDPLGIAVLALGPYARYIPKSALAGLLFITAYRLIDWKRLGYAIRATRFDAILVFVTAFAAIFISVEDSILIGVAISLLLFVPRVSKLEVRELIIAPEGVVRVRLPGESRSPSLVIYDIEGELFFGAAPELDLYLDRIRRDALNGRQSWPTREVSDGKIWAQISPISGKALTIHAEFFCDCTNKISHEV
jgi:sulfate permease, SulP family